ncbi:MAG: hypothetical protein LBJ70_00715 [Holosporales bacterium]|jgi:hypothetical protein|nr:hypothetical protein [Holosporales bacterium]
MHQETELILSVAGFPPYSGRSCLQQLMPAAPRVFQRTVNGVLSCVSLETAPKYRSVIRGRDISSPAFDLFWTGTQMSVGCIHRLWQRLKEGENRLTLTRPPVEHSVCVVDRAGQPVAFTREGQDVTLKTPPSADAFIGFCPWLTMSVLNFCFETDEWGTASAWQLVLEEV